MDIQQTKELADQVIMLGWEAEVVPNILGDYPYVRVTQDGRYEITLCNTEDFEIWAALYGRKYGKQEAA